MASLPARLDQAIEPWADHTPDAPALAETDRTWTYADLARHVAFLRGWLGQQGVRPGDRVMVVAENGIAQAALVLAISAAEAWSVVVNARLSPREIDLIRDHSGARRVLYGIALSPDARAHAERHGADFIDLPAVGALALGPLASDVVPEPAAADPAKRVAVLLYTSGTTGAPKGVMLSHRNILFVATTARIMRGMGPEDRLYGVLPVAHIVGFATVLVATLLAGGSVHFAPRFQPEAALATLERQRITRFLGVPAMLQRIREHCTLQGNEEVVAFVQLRPGAMASADNLAAFAGERLAPYKRPAEIIVLDALPTNPTGKIMKQQLARQAAAAR
jgi:acyl-CoA synthetase (AMP-forming)/AMP-acid ligase II